MNVKPVQLGELLKEFSEYLTVADIMAAKVLAKISETIVRKRFDMGMTQSQFAEFMDVSQSMVSKWESEDYNFSIESLAIICDKLNMKLDIEMKSDANNYKRLLKNQFLNCSNLCKSESNNSYNIVEAS